MEVQKFKNDNHRYNIPLNKPILFENEVKIQRLASICPNKLTYVGSIPSNPRFEKHCEQVTQ